MSYSIATTYEYTLDSTYNNFIIHSISHEKNNNNTLNLNQRV